MSEPNGRRGASGAEGRVRLADVAREAGVVISTASRVLNGDPTVSARPETRRRILEAARQLGYTPNAFARGLKLARTSTIGLVLPNLAYAVNAEIISGAERRAAEAGYVVVAADGDEFAPANGTYRQLLLEGRIDGLLVASTRTGDQLIDDIRGRNLPLVLLNRRAEGDSVCVSLDDAAGIRIAVEHMASLGHTRVAHLAGPLHTDTARRRAAGFRETAEQLGVAARGKSIVEAEFNEEGGYGGMQQLFRLRSRPTAVVCASFAAAIGAMAAIRERGLRIPEDISIVGFHDAPLARYLSPPLTTVRMALREMGETAVEVLVRQIEGDEVESRVIPIPPVLIERSSTAPPPG